MMIQKLTLGSTTENTMGTTLVKISVTIFILRLIQRTYQPIRYILIGQLAILVPITIATFIVLLTQCRPLAKYWDPSVEGYCIDGNAVSTLLKANNGEQESS